MCNIAGYVGTKDAAPVLIEMMKREEGFAGGYYTGIATIHEGKIYYAKLTGDLQRLLELTDAAKLPGNIGIIHSRSKSGGGDEWAHPFVGMQKEEVVTAYVANGSSGCFAVRNKEYGAMAEKLSAEGYAMAGSLEMKDNIYPLLSNGTRVHMSDVMCQLITKYILEGADGAAALERAYCEMPGEIVGLLLSLAQPEGIFFSRINRPMMLGFVSHGAYLGTTAMAFPEEVCDVQCLPACSAGCVYKDQVVIKPFQNPPASVAKLDAHARYEAYRQISSALKCNLLEEEGISFDKMEEAMKAIFEPADCLPNALAAYEVLYSLKNQGKLEIETCRVPGAGEGMDAPEFRMRIKE